METTTNITLYDGMTKDLTLPKLEDAKAVARAKALDNSIKSSFQSVNKSAWNIAVCLKELNLIYKDSKEFRAYAEQAYNIKQAQFYNYVHAGSTMTEVIEDGENKKPKLLPPTDEKGRAFSLTQVVRLYNATKDKSRQGVETVAKENGIDATMPITEIERLLKEGGVARLTSKKKAKVEEPTSKAEEPTATAEEPTATAEEPTAKETKPVWVTFKIGEAEHHLPKKEYDIYKQACDIIEHIDDFEAQYEAFKVKYGGFEK